MKDIVEILRKAGFGVVEGKEAVLKKIEEIGRSTSRMPPGATEKPAGEFK